MTHVNRRTVVGAAWAVPVILAATAAPAAAASGDHPTPSACESGALAFAPYPASASMGNGSVTADVLVKDGTGVVATNTTAGVLVLPVVFWTDKSQVALTQDGAEFLVSKDGNKAATTVTLLPGQSCVFQVSHLDSHATAHLQMDCRKFHFKAVTA